MPWYPYAVKRKLPQNDTQDRLDPRSIVLHTAVNDTRSLYDYFKTNDRGVQAHFYIAASGVIEQYIDTHVVAHAQWDGNAHAISIETADNAAADPDDINPWNTKQLDALARLGAWLCRSHDIPAAACTAPDGAGIGYHSQFDTWNHSHHACPAKARIVQVSGVIEAIAEQTGSDADRLPTVSVYQLRRAARLDPGRPQGGTTPDAAPSVRIVERALDSEALLASKWVDGSFGTKTIAAYATWQRQCGYTGSDADGIPGRASLTKLGRKHGFRVVD